ncbi:MAG: HAD hydrolase family protein [Planctomycetota bacterium]
MQYRLIAIDLDGTLLCPEGNVSEENRAALHEAHEAGAMIIPCTGRGWGEAKHALASVPDSEVGVFNTGAMVCGLRDGSTHHSEAFESEVASAVVDLLCEGDEAVLVYTDPDATGYEYVVTGRGELTTNTRWWFEENGLRWVEQPVMERSVLEHVVRAGAMAVRARADEIGELVDVRLPGRTSFHAFEAVQEPDFDEPMFILECFKRGVSKWTGIQHIARQYGISADEIAVIGDQINDVPMFEKAGCAVAMGNAIPVIKETAHYHTLKNDEHGVAHAIKKMLAGSW